MVWPGYEKNFKSYLSGNCIKFDLFKWFNVFILYANSYVILLV